MPISYIYRPNGLSIIYICVSHILGIKFILLFALHTIVDAGIFLSPCNDYTTFENCLSTFSFNCSGNGTFLLWTVDEQSAGSSYVLNRGIRYTPSIITPDGLTVSSQLIVPTTKANNNITVICIVQGLQLNYRLSSDPVKLFVQGQCTCTVRYY